MNVCKIKEVGIPLATDECTSQRARIFAIVPNGQPQMLQLSCLSPNIASPRLNLRRIDNSATLRIREEVEGSKNELSCKAA